MNFQPSSAQFLNAPLAALSYLDDKAIIHRDIKLPNILLHDGKLKLADFGISKVLSGEYAKTVMGGTPHYMAPELMSKNQYYHALSRGSCQSITPPSACTTRRATCGAWAASCALPF
jgi:serine/threonine protein kinase